MSVLGDRRGGVTEYVALAGHIVGDEHGFETVYTHIGTYPSLAAAKRHGLNLYGSDDFNIAMVRQGKIVRWTWMGEDIGETPEVMAELEQWLP